jgi:large subunit ribosomal protein L17
MKHRIGFNALDRRSAERRALKRSMVTSLFKYERIETTRQKALEVRKMAEKMITRAKVDGVHQRRIVSKDIADQAIVAKLFTEIAPLFKERNGGYTRILKTGYRLGDAAEMVILELVEKTETATKKAEKKAMAKEAKAEKKAEKKTEEPKDEDKAVKKHASSARSAKAQAGMQKAASVRKTMAGGAGGGDK